MPFSIRPYRRFPVHATTLLPGQDNPAPSSPMSGASCFVVSCGVRLSEVGLSEFRKPQVRAIGAKLVPKHPDTP
jgi:hypothetical protein